MHRPGLTLDLRSLDQAILGGTVQMQMWQAGLRRAEEGGGNLGRGWGQHAPSFALSLALPRPEIRLQGIPE